MITKDFMREGGGRGVFWLGSTKGRLFDLICFSQNSVHVTGSKVGYDGVQCFMCSLFSPGFGV